MNRSRRLRAETLAALAFWLFVSSLYAAQIVWLAEQPGERINLRLSLTWQGAFYLCWVPLTVVVWRVASAWTPSATGWLRYLIRHVGLAIVVSVAHAALGTLTAAVLMGSMSEPFVTMLVGQLRSRGYLEALIYAAVAASGHAIWLYDQWRSREAEASRLEAEAARLEVELSTAQLGALQAQVHPHFLFNSLHAIASLARDGRSADVVKTVADLSDLLRRVMEPQQSTLPLSMELDLARRYFDIQQIRFGDRLRVAIDIPAEAMSVDVPALTLQPLIDNAVRHGISPAVRGGTVRVSAAVSGATLTIRVDDDGDGAPMGWTLDATAGTGLRNLRSRFAILYGTRASLAAGPGTNGGFSVIVRVPVTR